MTKTTTKTQKTSRDVAGNGRGDPETRRIVSSGKLRNSSDLKKNFRSNFLV
jgi:hypothetical protein